LENQLKTLVHLDKKVAQLTLEFAGRAREVNLRLEMGQTSCHLKKNSGREVALRGNLMIYAYDLELLTSPRDPPTLREPT
jgi:hypothetical protein